MGYDCQNFKDGQVLTAACLNKMEQGIVGAFAAVPPACENKDCSRVLSYSESGFEWIPLPEGAEVDPTLTQSGKAADAKAVGDALEGKQPKGNYATKSEIPDVPTKVSAFENDKGYLTEQNLSGYAKSEDIPAKPSDIGAQPAGNYAEKEEIPTTLPNPHKLTFSGAVNAEYDGSEAVEVVIPQGGGGGGAVASVNGQTGAVVLDAADVGALPLSGGTMTGELRVNGGDAAGGSKIVLEGNGMITDSGTSTLLGLWQGKTYYVGHSKYATTMRGSAARPTYNGNDLALYSDITAGGGSGGSGGGLKLAARVTTTENSAAIAVTGLGLKLPISIRMYNAGQNTGNGICISVNGNQQKGYAGVQNEDDSASAKNRVWLYEADGKMISSVSLANFTATQAEEAYHTWNFVPSVIESIELTSVYHTDGGEKYYQAGTIVEIYEGVYPNVW